MDFLNFVGHISLKFAILNITPTFENCPGSKYLLKISVNCFRMNWESYDYIIIELHINLDLTGSGSKSISSKEPCRVLWICGYISKFASERYNTSVIYFHNSWKFVKQHNQVWTKI